LADSGRVVRRTETIHKLRFDVVSKERNIQASVLSAEGNLAMMERLLDEIADTERIQPLATVIVHLEKYNYAWNERYLATTTLGQKYDGTSAGSGGANFFFHDDKNRIFVGSLKDLSVSGQLIP
jgi:cell filamentation protein